MTQPARRIRVCSRPNYWRKRTTTWTAHNMNGSRCSRTDTSSGSPCPPTEAATEIPCSHCETARDPLEYVANGDHHKQLALPVSTYSNGGWKYEFKTSSLTTTILNRIFNKVEKNGKNHNFRTYIGPGSDGSSTDKLSLVNPRNTAISSRLGEEHCMCKTFVTQGVQSRRTCWSAG